MEFRLSEYNEDSIILRFTKEGFTNFKNLIKITGEDRYDYYGLKSLDKLLSEINTSENNDQ